MQKTSNYNLKKPEPTDPLRVEDFNENADIIDAALKSAADSRPYVIGSYYGTNDAGINRVVELGFQAKAILIDYPSDSTGEYGTMITPEFPVTYDGKTIAKVTETGFEVGTAFSGNYAVKPYVNSGGPYIYIAFR